MKERVVNQISDSLRGHRPSENQHFTHRVQFLIAVRTGDVSSVRAPASGPHAGHVLLGLMQEFTGIRQRHHSVERRSGQADVAATQIWAEVAPAG